jgi:hypothetical protein
MNSMKYLLLFCFTALFLNARAYITYTNGRIDRALYDGHDPKTVIAGKITGLHYRLIPNPSKYEPIPELDGGPLYSSVDFSIQNVIMGNYDLAGTSLNLRLSSFTWPEELVKLDTNVFCILILREYKNEEYKYMIEVVVPSTGESFSVEPGPRSKARDNATTRLFLENELLLVLKTKIDRFKLRETLLLLGPILRAENVKEIVKFVEYKNDWVIRTALACIVYANHDPVYTKMLATNINNYFSTYKENDVLKAGDDLEGYATHYIYYNYVFFLDPSNRVEGSRWDDAEAERNKQAILKLKETGKLSDQVSKTLKI